jgi:hypothetical protein
MAIAFRNVTSAAQASGTVVTLALPGGVKEGDLLLAVLLAGGGSSLTVTPPAGWTVALRTNDGTTAAQLLLWLRYTGGGASSVAFALSSSVAAIGHLLAYGGVDQVVPVDVSGGQANASSTSCTAPSVTTTKSSALLVGAFGGESGAPSATPPSGMTERADSQAGAFGLSVADAVQGTLGTSGTKVATLSGACANLGQLLALAPSALNTPAAVRDEGNWRFDGWSPRVANDTAMDALVEGLIQRANVQVRLRVGSSFYAANVLADPYNGLLKEAEMHLAQALLLDAAAEITEAGNDNNPAPFLGTGDDLRALAAARRVRAEEIFRTTRSADRPGPQGPYFAGASTTAPVRTLFDATDGLA